MWLWEEVSTAFTSPVILTESPVCVCVCVCVYLFKLVLLFSLVKSPDVELLDHR